MTTLRKQLRGLLLSAFLLMVPAAVAQRVRIDSTPGIDFSHYKTYTWRAHPVFEKNPRLAEKYSVGIELVKMSVNKRLLARGFGSTDISPDLIITYLLTGENRQDIDVIDMGGMYGWGGWYGWGSYYYPGWSETIVTNYLAGELILDFVDAKTKELVWRAYCQSEIKDWSNRDKDIDKAVNKALKKFPPKTNATKK